jgi:hypothetical protein
MNYLLLFTWMIILLCGGVLAAVRKQIKRNVMKKLLYRFSQLGTEYNLTFSGQEILGNALIGLDGMKRKLLVLKKAGETGYDILLIDLQTVKHCTIKKYYGTISAGALKRNPLEQFLKRLVLRVEFHPDTSPVEIDFYHHGLEPASRIREMEIRSRHWGTLLNKMLTPPARHIA